MARLSPSSPLAALFLLIAFFLTLPALDLIERLILYDVLEKDRGSVLRLLRRPLRDTSLSVLHRIFPSPERQAAQTVWNFRLKPEDEQLLRNLIASEQQVGTPVDDIRGQWIPARMEADGRGYDVRVRLRGSQYNHVVPPRPSLRVRMRFGQSYRDTTLFNLVEPFDKITDQFFASESAEFGLITYDQDLGLIAFNDQVVGVTQFVEQVRRATTDHARRPEGMLFKGSGEIYEEGGDPLRCAAVVEEVVGWLSDGDTIVPFERLSARMSLPRLTRFMAISELSGSRHGFLSVNIKGYCDPVSVRAEFIVWDTNLGDWTKVAQSKWPWQGTQILYSDAYRLLHDRVLYELIDLWLEPALGRLETYYAEHSDLFESDPFFWTPRGDEVGGFLYKRPERFLNVMRRNSKAIREKLEGEDWEFSVDAEHRILAVINPDRGSKRAQGVIIERAGRRTRAAFEHDVPIYGRIDDHQPTVGIPLPPDVSPTDVRGVYGVHDLTGKELEASLSEVPLQPTTHFNRGSAPERGLPILPAGFRIHRAERRVEIGPGLVHIDGHLRLPIGWSVRVAPGTRIEAGPDALFEIQGDLRMVGSPDAPIVMTRAATEPWGALAIQGVEDAPVSVHIGHTRIVDGAGSNAGLYHYSGVLAIAFADVRLDHLTIDGARADDAMNLKYSTVAATDCEYLNGAGDAVDYDFTSGTDYRTRIANFPDDGIDISGGNLYLEGAVIQNMGDKALSIGEGSSAHIVDVRVSNVTTGLAVKDASDARVDRLTVVRADVGVALYTKKLSFGPARATLTDFVAADVQGVAVVDAGSDLELRDARRLVDADMSAIELPGLENIPVEGLAAWSTAELMACARQVADCP